MKNRKILLRGTARNMRGGGGAGVRVRVRLRVAVDVSEHLHTYAPDCTIMYADLQPMLKHALRLHLVLCERVLMASNSCLAVALGTRLRERLTGSAKYPMPRA